MDAENALNQNEENNETNNINQEDTASLETVIAPEETSSAPISDDLIQDDITMPSDIDEAAPENDSMKDIPDETSSDNRAEVETSEEIVSSPTQEEITQHDEGTSEDGSEENIPGETSSEKEAEVETSEEIPTTPTQEEGVQSEEAPAEDIDDGRDWFVIHCYSGYENKVRHNLEQRIETMNMKGMIFDVVIPTQEEIEVRDGKRRTVERHVFPGYVLVNMKLTEESWYVVRNTPGVTGFVGMGNEPTPLRTEEVAHILKQMEAEAPHIKVSFKIGERVRIVDGPFNDFRGTVSEIDLEKTKVRVMVNFFGRETPVELDFLQVEKS